MRVKYKNNLKRNIFYSIKNSIRTNAIFGCNSPMGKYLRAGSHGNSKGVNLTGGNSMGRIQKVPSSRRLVVYPNFP